MMTEDLINCGERTIQAQHRIYIGNTFCKRHGIEVDDYVEVFIKLVKKGDE